MKFSLWLILFFIPFSAEARVFNFGKESFAAYFGGTAGQTGLGKGAVEGESGANITFSGESKTAYSGEFGFVYSRPQVSFRFGFEMLSPAKLDGSTANNGTTDLYSVDSDVLGYLPKLAVDVNLRGTGSSRSYISVAVGSASVTMKNDYTFTAAGSAAFPGSETATEAKGTAIMYSAAFGHEALMTDTTTVLCELGYRSLKIDNLAYSKDVTIFNQSHTSGDKVTDSSGSQRSLDLSGLFIGLSFRFYL